MAGTTRPSECSRSKESKYKVIGGNCYQGTITESFCPILDGVENSGWATKESFFWNEQGSYFEVEIMNLTRIWTYGMNNAVWNASLTIYRKEGNDYVDVSDTYKIQRLGESIPGWYVLYEKVPAGIYKFVSSYRVDSEWFFEASFVSKFLLKKNDKYMTIIDNALVEYTGDTVTLDKATVENPSDFLPFIDNTNNYQLISEKPIKAIISGIKTTKSMLATLEGISLRKYNTIHKITATTDITNGDIKFIFSFDKGATWKTYDISSSKWNGVNVDIPIKLYENFSDTDKTNWNTARDTILSDGISVQDLGNVDFQSVKTDKLMFAVAFNRPSYADTCTLKGLNINYDGLETYTQLACGSDLSKYEAKVSITGDSVEVKTAGNQDKILVTMTTNI